MNNNEECSNAKEDGENDRVKERRDSVRSEEQDPMHARRKNEEKEGEKSATNDKRTKTPAKQQATIRKWVKL